MALIDNCFAYYKFDNSSGTTMTDSTPSGLDGNAGGAQVGQTGKIDLCYYLQDLNSGNTATLPSNAAFTLGTSDFSISLWIKGDFTANFGTAVVGSDGSWGANSTAIKWDWSGGGFAQRIAMNVRNAANSASLTLANSSNLSADTWYHVVFTRSGNTLNLYLNGSLDNSSTGWSGYNFNFRKSGGSPTMGWWAADSGDTDLQIYVDEKGWWNRTLTSGEVTELYNGGAGLSYPFTSAFTPSPMMHHMAISGGLM